MVKKILTLLCAFALSIPMWAITYTYNSAVATGTGTAYICTGSTFSGTSTSVTQTAGNSYKLTMKATAGTNYTFKGWATSSTATSYVSTSATYTVSAPYGSTTYYAFFESTGGGGGGGEAGAVTVAGTAKTVNIYQAGTGAGGKTILYTLPTGAVDLGTGVAWANKNVGSTTEIGTGSWFYWGATAAQSSASSSSFYNAGSTKKLPTSKDAATQIMSDAWRMPTKAEMTDLLSNATWEWNSTSKYFTITNKLNTSNYIKLPACGYKSSGSNAYSTGYCYYWTCEKNDTKTTAVDQKPYFLNGAGGAIAPSASSVTTNYACYYHMPVRAVYSNVTGVKTLTIKAGTYIYTYLCASGQKITVTPNAGTGYKFSNWTKTAGTALTVSGNTFTVNADATYTAEFATSGYNVTLTNDGNGSATANSTTAAVGQSTTLNNVTSVNLSCSPSTGYEFDYWTKDGTKQTWSATQNSVAISAACTIKAFFKKKQYAIAANVASSCTGWGTVSGGGTYEHDAEVTLEATAETGYNFEKWNDGTNDITTNPLVFNATEAKTYTAYFASASTTYTVQVTKNIDAAGEVKITSDGEGKTVIPGTGLTSGTEIFIHATPASGYRFVRWADNGDDYESSTRRVVVSTNQTFTATFEALTTQTDAIYQDMSKNGRNLDYSFDDSDPLTLTIIGNGKNTYKCLKGQQVTITAYNEADWAFSKWSDENTNATRTFTVTEDATYRAIYVSSPGTPGSSVTPVVPTHDVKIYQDNASNGETKSYASAVTVDGAVDLGLSVLWATKNVGASTETGIGNYYRWGETTPSGTYGSSSGYSRPVSTDLPVANDAATANMGGNWRMPTKAEIDELQANATYAVVTVSSVRGLRYTSNVTGYTSKSIFLPLTGSCQTAGSSAVTNGPGNSIVDALYWSKSFNTTTNKAYRLGATYYTNGGSIYFSATSYTDKLYDGCVVRAVCPAPARYTLTVKSQNGTTVGDKVNKYTFDDDHNTVTIYAKPKDDGSRFVQWSDGNTANPRTFTVTESKEITAEFMPYTGTTTGAGDWNAAATWTNSIMPSKTTDVTISHAVTVGDAVDNVYVFQALANAKNVTANAALTVKNGAYLTVAGTMTVANTVTLKSGSTTKISGLTINNGGSLVIEDGANVTLPATITNNGTITSGKALSVTTLTNAGTMNVTGDLTVTTLTTSNNITATAITATTLNYNGGTLTGNVTAGTLVNGTTLNITSDFAWNITSAITNNSALNIKNGAQLVIPTLTTTTGTTTVEPTAVLKVTSGITSTNTTLVLQSSAEGNATMILPTSGSTIQPAGSVQLYTNCKQGVWQHFGIPTTAQPTITKSADAGTWINKWADSVWTKVSGISELNTPFVGYNMTNNSASVGVVYTFAGTLVGNAGNGYNFEEGWTPFANSYTSAIKTDELLKSLPTAAEASILLYNPANGSSYQTATLSSLAFATIGSMQSFFIKATESASQEIGYGSLLNDPTISSAPARGGFTQVDYSALANVVVATDKGEDMVRLMESEDLTSGMDRHYDASKLRMSGMMQIYAMGSANEQAILATNSLNGTYLGFAAGEESEYTISFNGVDGNEYILRDMTNGQEFVMEEGASYTFYAEPNSTNDHRFMVTSRQMPTDLDDAVENNSHVSKIVENGHVIIIKNGVRYDMVGAEVK